jgi:TRAP-type C4-dicarboxylate transport system permease small subunit
LVELWALAASTLLAFLLAFFSVRLVMQSIEFNDVSTSMDATPLWIPQLTMAIGTLIFLLAMVDELILHLQRHREKRTPVEATHHE